MSNVSCIPSSWTQTYLFFLLAVGEGQVTFPGIAQQSVETLELHGEVPSLNGCRRNLEETFKSCSLCRKTLHNKEEKSKQSIQKNYLGLVNIFECSFFFIFILFFKFFDRKCPF